MTARVIPSADAPTALPLNWNSIDWKKVVAHVRQLQLRIAKAFREDRVAEGGLIKA
jgi:RNA-directed DNA polymerase